MSLLSFLVLSTSSLFVIVDPIATVPAFLAMTPNDPPAQRVRMARLACVITAGVLLVFALAGNWIFRFFGITVPAFEMAGSIVLLLVALDMLRAQRSRVHETQEETIAGTEKEDIAVTPLAVPMLAGPGAITTVLLLRSRAADMTQEIALQFAILLVCAASFLIFAVSAHGARWLNPIILRLTTRLMGLFLAAIAMQFLVNALRELQLVR